MPKVGKPKSKRTPVRLRHKIEKASAAKQRKSRKLAKKNPEWRSRLKKDPGIPNLFPYKDKILREIEDSKRRKEEDAVRRREEAKARRAGNPIPNGATLNETAEFEEAQDEDDEVLMDYEDMSEEEAEMEDADSANPMAALLASARARASDYNRTNGAGQTGESEEDLDEDDSVASWEGVDESTASSKATPKDRDSSRRAYDKAFQEVLSASDVLLYILDARDPLGTRSFSIEQTITSNCPDKRLILVLNKIDLVPPHILKSWLIYLRRSFPTLPLRTTTSSPNSRTFSHAHLTPQHTATTLLKALKSYSTSKHFKRALTVGIIGYPNTGKSSVINAIISRHSPGNGSRNQRDACPVGAEAGVTTAMRQIKLDSKLRLLDSPGIVFPSASTANVSHGNASTSRTTGSKDKIEEQARLILLNAIPPHEITDPQPAVSLLLHRLQQSEDLFSKLKETYSITALMGDSSKNGDITTDFLVQVARKRGRLGKGGVPNLHAAAQTVLSDWRDGRITGWVEPPTQDERAMNGSAAADEKAIVTTWTEEFKLDGLFGDKSNEVLVENGSTAMDGVER